MYGRQYSILFYKLTGIYSPCFSCFLSPPIFPSRRLFSLNAKRSWLACIACLFTSMFITLTGSWASAPSPTSTPATSISTTSSQSFNLLMRRSSHPCRRWPERSALILSLLQLPQVQQSLNFQKLNLLYFQSLTNLCFPLIQAAPPATKTHARRHFTCTSLSLCRVIGSNMILLPKMFRVK